MKFDSLWRAARLPKFKALKSSDEFDVAVIGGGITGLTAAYLLKQEGQKVCVLERDRIGNVDTGSTTAHLTYVTDLRLSQLVDRFGEEGAALVWEAGAIAIDTIEAISREERIDCDFRRVPGFLHAALDGDKDESAELQRDAKLAKKLGFPAKFEAAIPYVQRPGIRFPNQAKFHPLKYLAGLATRIEGGGSRIFEQAEVSEVKPDPQRVVVGKHEIKAKYVIIATHVPLTGKTGLVSATLFQSKIFPYSSYVIGATIPKKLIPEASFWDTAEPYHYLRVESGKSHDYVIFGGADHKTGQEVDTEDCYVRLEQTLLTLIPEAKLDRRWSGQVIETNDGLPYIGETADHQFAATGYAGNGMTFGTLAGLMARDAVLGRDNPWKSLLSVTRTKLRGGLWRYLAENFDYPFYYVKDRLTRPEGESTRSVKRGEGKVIELDGERVACARDADGTLTTVSAYCTHMGCIIHWNGAEQTWDCPCHGSRFHPDGEVLAGPAETPLEPHKKPKPAKAKKSAKKKASVNRKTK